jgi:hypothetical protein
MVRPQRHFPSLPDIGFPESHYAQLARTADQAGDHYGREAAKVGQYITLAMDPRLDWMSKRRFFEHALRRHCMAPPLPNEQVWLFYQSLAMLVRKHAGQEALRLASAEDDLYAMLAKSKVPRDVILGKAQVFFGTLMGMHLQRPDWFSEEDWAQLKIIRAQWIRQ